jgi:hypothetical protein
MEYGLQRVVRGDEESLRFNVFHAHCRGIWVRIKLSDMIPATTASTFGVLTIVRISIELNSPNVLSLTCRRYRLFSSRLLRCLDFRRTQVC